ncbi:hypothetical protein [Geodermatophilus siccatus]|uniref:hypothetical protein n=1 Tax=Geodermatophilus siccatus TaxID=1137991 RepID=UPI001C31CE15|nr:hypothetical protein [Geodermatophilus siccatus]
MSNLSRVSLSSDTVFGDDGGASQLATVTRNVTGGYTLRLAVGVDTATIPTGGGTSGGGAPSGAPGGPPPGGGPGGTPPTGAPPAGASPAGASPALPSN